MFGFSPFSFRHISILITYLLSFQGHNLLQKLYEDPKRWAFLFQTYIQLTMLQEHNKPCSAPVKIMERSLLRRDPVIFKAFSGSEIIFGQNQTILPILLVSKEATCF